MLIKTTEVDLILKLRHKVLRFNKPIKACFYSKDKHPLTIHLAATKNNLIMSCATLYPEQNNHINHKKSFRLRGMATEKKFRNKGYGKQLLKFSERIIKKRGGNNIWCNARINAIPFYLSCGYIILGNMFTIKEIGKHYMMYKNI